MTLPSDPSSEKNLFSEWQNASLDQLHARLQFLLKEQEKILEAKTHYFEEQEVILFGEKARDEKKSEIARIQVQIDAAETQFQALESEYDILEKIQAEKIQASDESVKPKNNENASLGLGQISQELTSIQNQMQETEAKFKELEELMRESPATSKTDADRFEQLKKNLPDLPPIPVSAPIPSAQPASMPIQNQKINSSTPSPSSAAPIASTLTATHKVNQSKPQTVGAYIQKIVEKYLSNTQLQFVGTITQSRASQGMVGVGLLMKSVFFLSLTKSGKGDQMSSAISLEESILPYLDPWKLINPFCWVQSALRAAFTGAAFGIDSLPGFKSGTQDSSLPAKIAKFFLSPLILANVILDIVAVWPYQIAKVIQFAIHHKKEKDLPETQLVASKKSGAHHSTSHVYQDGLHAKPAMNLKADANIQVEKKFLAKVRERVGAFFLNRKVKGTEKNVHADQAIEMTDFSQTHPAKNKDRET